MEGDGTMEGEKYVKRHEYRIVCAGNHIGPKHMFDKANLGVALSAARQWNKAKSEDTRRNCLPMTIQSRTVMTWTTLWTGGTEFNVPLIDNEFDRVLEDVAADPEL